MDQLSMRNLHQALLHKVQQSSKYCWFVIVLGELSSTISAFVEQFQTGFAVLSNLN